MRDEAGSVRLVRYLFGFVLDAGRNGELDTKFDHNEAEAAFSAPGHLADALDLDVRQRHLAPLGEGVERQW